MKPGIDTLLTRHRDWLRGKRVAALTHQAAVDHCGESSAARLHDARDIDLVSIFGPEHGYFGTGDAGAPVRSRRHPHWAVPMHSLYGPRRRPTERLLRNVDVMICDLQDLGARPYTYVASLRYMLESCAAYDVEVIVADRPIPLPWRPDGPVTEDTHTSFVAAINAPMMYAMTPGETARWLTDTLALDVRLRIARLQGFSRRRQSAVSPAPWIAPSPAILSWDAAMCYTATVFVEAIPSIYIGRRTSLSFQFIGADWIRAPELLERLRDARLPGLSFYPHRLPNPNRSSRGAYLDGLRMVVSNPRAFRPITTSVTLLAALRDCYGDRLWRDRNCRPAFFDALYGTGRTREALRDGLAPLDIVTEWQSAHRRYAPARRRHLLYQP
jgi:uncharacterized protein YbbC (DUF1343 family)